MSRRDDHDVLSDWYGRDARRVAPEVDFGMAWRTIAEPNERWRVSWNGGSGELFAARLDRSEVEVFGTYPDVDSVSTALGDWAPRALEVGGLDRLRYEMRDAGRADLVRESYAVVGEDERGWLRERLADPPVVRPPDLGAGIERP